MIAVSPFRQLERGVDVSFAMEQINRHPELWGQVPFRTIAPGTPHRDVTDIWLRYNDYTPFQKKGNFKKFNDKHIPVWYPAWRTLTALHPLVHNIAGKAWAEMIGGVLLTKLVPGAAIDKHVDHGWHVDYYDKLYLTLQSAPGAVFGAEVDGIVHESSPATGDLVRFDNRVPHWVRNDSDVDRITLIICVRTEVFRQKEITRATTH